MGEHLARRSTAQPAIAMNRLSLALGLTLGIAPVSAQSARPAVSPPQQLPITAQWCLEAPQQVCIGLEVAGTPQQQAMGLQLRPKLPPLRGMWFPFATPTPTRFWMHLTPQPLDMVFVSQLQVVAVVTDAQPCMRLPCRGYGPAEPVDGVIELAGGEAARLGIGIGTQVVISPMDTPLPAAGR